MIFRKPVAIKTKKIKIKRHTGDRMVAVDCLALPHHFSGAANYIYHHTLALLHARRDFNITVLCRAEHDFLFKQHLQPGDQVKAIRLRNRLHRLIYYATGLKKLLQQRGIRLFYATHYVVPPASPDYSLITTFHDLGFILHPDYYSRLKCYYFGSQLRRFLLRSDGIVAVSQATAAAIRAYCPEVDTRVQVNIPGTDHYRMPQQHRLLQPEIPCFLAVNTLEKRKNIPFLIRLFNELKQHYHMPHRLIIIGQKANGYRNICREIARSPYREDIDLTFWVPEEVLHAYYEQCDAFLNASEYEGFGFTPLEAIRHQKPVFLYRHAVVAELLGKGECLFDVLDESRWAATIWQEWQNGYPGRIREALLAPYSWHASGQRAVRQIEECLLKRDVTVAAK